MSDIMLHLLVHLVLLIDCRNLSYFKIGTQIVTQNNTTFPGCLVGPAWNQRACLKISLPHWKKKTHLQASVSSSANISCESHHDNFVDKTKGALCEYLADGAQKQRCGEGEGHELIHPLLRVWVQGVGELPCHWRVVWKLWEAESLHSVQIHEKWAFANTVVGAECPGHIKGIVQKNYSSQQKLNLDKRGLKFR
jgi:hypothetical protein